MAHQSDISGKYQISYPPTPGVRPTARHRCLTLREARAVAHDRTAHRGDLAGQDVRIEYADSGRLVEYAGPCR